MKNKLFILMLLSINGLTYSFLQSESFPYLARLENRLLYCLCKEQEGWLYNGEAYVSCKTLENNLQHARETGELKGFDQDNQENRQAINTILTNYNSSMQEGTYKECLQEAQALRDNYNLSKSITLLKEYNAALKEYEQTLIEVKESLKL